MYSFVIYNTIQLTWPSSGKNHNTIHRKVFELF